MKKMREISISLSKVKLAFSNRFYDMNFVKNRLNCCHFE